jgi:mono/diheme cytochrome c family protein
MKAQMKTSPKRVLAFPPIVASLAWLCALSASGSWGSAQREQAPRPATSDRSDDDADRQERLALGKRAFEENCLMCHAAEMAAGQRLTSAQWTTEVDKMIGWGAPLPPELKDDLLAYLTSSFSPSAAPAALARIKLAQALAPIAPEPNLPSGDAARGAPLYVAQCANCHGPDGRGAELGTSLVEKPVLNRPSEFSTVIRAGRRRMPGFDKVLTGAQVVDIFAWLREQRSPSMASLKQ